jgi:Protein of unknown function (DUF2795)
MGHTDKISSNELEENLKGANYPAKGDHLVQTAKGNGANERVVMFLEQIPADRTISGTPEVIEMLVIEDDFKAKDAS